MPKTKTRRVERVNVRLPKPMVEEIDRIVKKFKEMNWNRQQFIETAIREKIMRIKSIEANLNFTDDS